MLCAINFIRSAQLMHRNLCPDTILIDKNNKVKVSDLGSACIDENQQNQQRKILSNQSTDQELSTDSSGETGKKKRNKDKSLQKSVHFGKEPRGLSPHVC